VARTGQPRPRLARALRIAGALGIVAILFAGRTVWSLLHDGYLLLLTGAAASLVLGMHWQDPGSRRLPGLAWLRSCGRLSSGISLTSMFCVFVVIDLARWSGLDAAWGFAWYPLAIGASWLLGALVARVFSQPCERLLRRRLAAGAAPLPAVAVAVDV